MNCKEYSSMEKYYGVDGDVAPMTGSFWDCEASDEELREAFLQWLNDGGDYLDVDYPTSVEIYCDECGEWKTFEVTPGDVFTEEELAKINEEEE